MHIQHIEISNFRKLKAVRIDFGEEKTIFVGANNSGKTSAMVALRRFLVDPTGFTITDLTLSHWKALNDAGVRWEAAAAAGEPVPVIDWTEVLPFIDVWLKVELKELQYVRKLLPDLDWGGGALGVRLRYEPKEGESLQRDYIEIRKQVSTTLAAATGSTGNGEGGGQAAAPKVSLWPGSVVEFLERRLTSYFTVRGYLLDPAKLIQPQDGRARPQTLPADTVPLEGDPFKGLIAIDEISAQRGFGQTGAVRRVRGDDQDADRTEARYGKRLSSQLRMYYSAHLDPYESPEPKDFEALQALQLAGLAFDERLKGCFAGALKELEDLGYPGVTDPKLTISTRIRATDGLNHDAAVQYEVPTFIAGTSSGHRLPEESNGLGYQNLVSMVFGLMSFRDGWMQVGKAGHSAKAKETFIPPLHLVLVEEPEAHLHAQVQQVFIKQAYGVLRKHPKLGDLTAYRTQLVVSTHSSHVAHACDFASLRYFRRLPARDTANSVPTASVVNLSEVFGTGDQTEKFVTRYLKASHCDLFFADGAVLVEGPAERILVPHFVEEREDYQYLRRCYVTWLEIGGSHAHRLRKLIDHLGLTTLVITDLDAKHATTQAAVVPKRGQSQRSRNETLKTWVPGIESLDALVEKEPEAKVLSSNGGYSVRVAYQTPLNLAFKEMAASEVLANTFEDALVYQNVEFFAGREGVGLISKIRDAIAAAANQGELSAALHDVLKGGGKAECALDILFSTDVGNLVVPSYIHEGLLWLISQLKQKEQETIMAGGNP